MQNFHGRWSGRSERSGQFSCKIFEIFFDLLSEKFTEKFSAKHSEIFSENLPEKYSPKFSEELNSNSYLNIRGLLLNKDKSKPSQLSDRMTMSNSLGCFMTESWLKLEILNSEVNIDGYNIFRCDKKGRYRGGVAAYLRQDLACMELWQFSNSVVDILAIKCKKLDCIFIIIYLQKVVYKNINFGS